MTAAADRTGGATADRLSARRDLYVDYALAALCVIGLLLVARQLVTGQVVSRGSLAPAGAELAFASSAVRRRADRTLVWENITTGQKAHQRDTVFVPPGSSAIFRFRDGSTLHLEEDSLIVIEALEPDEPGRERRVRVSLQRGQVSGKAGEAGLVVSTRGGAARLQTGAAARVSVDRQRRTRVKKLSGSTVVETAAGVKDLGADGIGIFDNQGRPVDAPVLRVKLTEPANDARYYFHQNAPTVRFGWNDPEGLAARIELASDREFARVRVARPVRGGTITLPNMAEGNTFWRLTDASGRPVSDAGFFVTIRDEPPQASSPGEGEVVSAPEGTPVRFAWTPVTGVTRYQLELSVDPDFQRGVMRFESDETKFWSHQKLAEAVYYWRVRANHPERTSAPFCRAVRFRLITRPLPAAPEALEVEYRF